MKSTYLPILMVLLLTVSCKKTDTVTYDSSKIYVTQTATDITIGHDQANVEPIADSRLIFYFNSIHSKTFSGIDFITWNGTSGQVIPETVSLRDIEQPQPDSPIYRIDSVRLYYHYFVRSTPNYSGRDTLFFKL
ncbi:MAG: hypothetical protein JSS76_08440 [Bacteroidetes bacterium]|nr:hypothetical protein [Bacteroidota bacterium]